MTDYQMVEHLRKLGLSNGMALGYHSGKMDLIADRFAEILNENKRQQAEIEKLKKFKAYFDDLYGTGLNISNWHLNGNLEPFDIFYVSALEEMVGDKE